MTHRYLPEPTKELWLENAQKFSSRWNFPNAIGAIDGKHVRIVCPSKTGSLFYNYKHFFSIVLLAIVDADYKFVCVDVGAYGKTSDSDIFQKSAFGEKFKNNALNVPPPSDIGNGRILPHVLLGDDAFPLGINMMKPYSQKTSKADQKKRVFNYRLSRARRTTENAFGILCHTFRIFFQPIAIAVETTDDLVLSGCILHNMLRGAATLFEGNTSEELDSSSHEFPRNNMTRMEPSHARNHTKEAENIRQHFKEYFSSREGFVPWQSDMINYRDN